MAIKEELPGFEKVDWDSEVDVIEDQQEEITQEGGTQEEEKTGDKAGAESEDVPKEGEPVKEKEPQKDVKAEEDVNKGEDVKVDEKKFDISFFNKSFGTQFETEDALKKAIEDSSKAKELESKVLEYETLKSDIEYYKDGFNPLDLFASEDDFRVQQFKKQNPDKDASVAYKAFTSDLSKSDDLDVLVMYEMLNSPGLKGGEAGALEIVADQCGLDMEDRDSWSSLQQNKLRKAANLARSEFKEMKTGIELPKNINLKEQREADAKAKADREADLKVKWDATVDNMFTNMDKVPIYDVDADGNKVELLNFVMDDNSKNVLKKGIAEYLSTNGKDVNEQAVKEAGQIVYERFILDNLPKIIKSYSTDLLARQEKKTDEEIHNAEKVTTDTKPASESEAEKQAFIDYALGNDAGFKKRPMF